MLPKVSFISYFIDLNELVNASFILGRDITIYFFSSGGGVYLFPYPQFQWRFLNVREGIQCSLKCNVKKRQKIIS